MSTVPAALHQQARGANPLLRFLLELPREPRLSVLVYHRVLREADPMRPSEPTGAEFEARMRWVAANFDVMPLSEAVRALTERRLPKRALCITFDDGYADNHDVALPILTRLNLPATFFIATGFLDGGSMFNDEVIDAVGQARDSTLDLESLGLGRHGVDTIEARRQAVGRILERLKYFEPRRRSDAAREIRSRAKAVPAAKLMMTSAQVAAVHKAGMTIGAHTDRHPILAGMPFDAAREEIERGRERLEAIIGGSVRLFAYPNGRPGRDYSREHALLVRELGFDGAVTTGHGAARAGDDIFQIPRFTPWDRANWRFGLRLSQNRFLSPAGA